MAKELKRIDISSIPELVKLAHEVRSTNEPSILQKEREDVAMLTGLPIAGAAIGLSVPPIGWQDEILVRFENILSQEPEGEYVTVPSHVRHGPHFSWLK